MKSQRHRHRSAMAVERAKARVCNRAKKTRAGHQLAPAYQYAVALGYRILLGNDALETYAFHRRADKIISLPWWDENILAHEVGHAILWEEGCIMANVQRCKLHEATETEVLQEEELLAWQKGEQFIALSARAEYWRVAKNSLFTYGVDI